MTTSLTYHSFFPEQTEHAPALLIHGFAATGLQMWATTGWLKRFLDAGIPAIIINLPFHTSQDLKDTAPSALKTAQPSGTIDLPQGPLIPALAEALAGLSRELASPIHALGFSAGARICYELASSYPEQVLSLTAGGLPRENHLPALASYLRARHEKTNPAIENLNPAFQEIIAESIIREESLFKFLSLAGDFSFSPAQHQPSCPTLLVRGSEDSIAPSNNWLAEPLKQAGLVLEELVLEKRNHVNALTSSAFKRAALDLIKNLGV